MKITVFGRAMALRSVAGQHFADGTFRGHAIDAIEPALPRNGIWITDGHNGPEIGELAYAEISRAGDLNCVAVLNVDEDAFARCNDRLFWSAEYMAQGAGGSASFISTRTKLTGLSVVTNPANTAARPLQWRVGDVRRPCDTGNWPGDWHHTTLLERAAARPRIETRARRIVDHRVTTRERIVGTNAWLVGGEYLVDTTPRSRPPGRIEHWTNNPNSIISVR